MANWANIPNKGKVEDRRPMITGGKTSKVSRGANINPVKLGIKAGKKLSSMLGKGLGRGFGR